jgi:anti-anti-sigma factor
MKLEKRSEKDVIILRPVGRLVGQLGAGAFNDIKDQFENHYKEGTRKFVFDLGGLDWIDSTGVAMILSLIVRAKGTNAKIRLAGAGKSKKLTIIPRLASLVELHDTVEEAVAAFDGE